MSWYKAGAVTSVAGTNIITGTGTLWSNPIFGIAPGQMIFVPGAGQVVIYEILSIDSDTRIRITSNSASSITDSEYAIVTTVSNSMSDLARRTAVQLALYQKLLEDWQQITTGTGLITLVAPDGTEVTISALGDLTADVEWLQENKDQIVNAAGYAQETKQYRDDALASATSASDSKDSAAVSATQAINAVNSIGTSVQDAQTAANTATTKAAQASADADRAEAAADTVDTEALLTAIDSKMPKSGGTFTGAVVLSGNATAALNPITKQQFDVLSDDAFTASKVASTVWEKLTVGGGWTGEFWYRRVLGSLQIHCDLRAPAAANGVQLTTLPEGFRPKVNATLVPWANRDASTLPMRLLIQSNTGAILIGNLGSAGPISGEFLIPFE
ncbi:hypothetical protein [Yersinia rohdei]|uniref:hypothetical protein n=1 Tax=Yersinia rohdei TaxID=29485 RepID=UPI0011A82870|nr:hypothetical protein [Yersinia rohdei]